MLSNYKTYDTNYKVVTPNEGSPAPLSPTPGLLTYRPRLMDANRRKDQINSEKDERCNRLKYASGPDHDRSKRTQNYSNLAKNRQAVANGLNQKDYTFSGSAGTGIALHLVKQKFNELIFEQEIPQSQTVQLIHKCLSGIANEYFHSNVHDVAKTTDEAFKALENRFNLLTLISITTVIDTTSLQFLLTFVAYLLRVSKTKNVAPTLKPFQLRVLELSSISLNAAHRIRMSIKTVTFPSFWHLWLTAKIGQKTF